MIMTGTADDEGNDDRGVWTSRWNGNGQSPSLAIVDALVDLQDTAPTSLDPLYNSIEADALDTLLRHDTGARVAVEFRYGDYSITVKNDGEIQIRDVEDPDT